MITQSDDAARGDMRKVKTNNFIDGKTVQMSRYKFSFFMFRFRTLFNVPLFLANFEFTAMVSAII